MRNNLTSPGARGSFGTVAQEEIANNTARLVRIAIAACFIPAHSSEIFLLETLTNFDRGVNRNQGKQKSGEIPGCRLRKVGQRIEQWKPQSSPSKNLLNPLGCLFSRCTVYGYTLWLLLTSCFTFLILRRDLGFGRNLSKGQPPVRVEFFATSGRNLKPGV